MKVLVASQPKTGNVWIRNLLARAYSLVDLNERFGDEIPEAVPEFLPWIREKEMPENAILHQHFFPRPELLEYAGQENIKLVTMIRSPYEAFVSFFYYVNRFPEIFRGRPPETLIGKDIDHEDVIAFLASNYRMHLNMSAQWVECNKSHVVRYEDLLADPLGELKKLVTDWQPSLSDNQISEAIGYCSVERTKKNGGWKAGHIRSAKAKTWDTHLSENHLRVFRDNYANLIAKTGYEVV